MFEGMNVRKPLTTNEAQVPDLYKIVLNLLNQIPSGQITTYKDIALALGDQRASRAVGTIMANNPRPDKFPCWRVVHSDGKVGKYSGPGGKEEKERKISRDGIEVIKGEIKQLDKARFDNFELDPPLPKLRKIQREVERKVSLDSGQLTNINTVGGVDVSYKEEPPTANYVEIHLEDKSKLIFSKQKRAEIKFPYIPSYLAFRELPLLENLLREIRHGRGLADVILVDGNGLLHPRRAGLASHLGVNLKHPTIGVAKTLLCGTVAEEDMEEGDRRKITDKEQILGYAVKTRSNANPIYISPGHRVESSQAARLALKCSKYKLPEPIRQAHKMGPKKATD